MYNKMRAYCFNTTNLTKIGVKLWDEDDEWEQINWYFRLEKCHEKNYCKSEAEIEGFLENLIVKNKLW